MLVLASLRAGFVVTVRFAAGLSACDIDWTVRWTAKPVYAEWSTGLDNERTDML